MATTRRRVLARLASFIAILSIGCLAPAFTTSAEAANAGVRVMTRNMDAGTDLNFLTAATTPEEFVVGLIETIAEVDASNIPARATRLAAEIAASKPDLVGLQEVTTWDFTDASGHRTYDQLALLKAALAAAGAQYRVVAVQTLTDIPAEVPGLLTARFIDHNAILARSDLPPGHLDVAGVQTHLFDNALPFVLPDGTIVPVRQGWMTADVKVRGARLTFVNTHLLSPIPGPFFEDTAGLQALQGLELLQALGQTTLPIVLAGDFNSDAEAAGIGPDQTATAGIITSAGFVDAWHTLHPVDTGFTWPLFLEDQLPPGAFPVANPNERIDLLFAVGATPVSISLTGTTASEQGVFASDHAGVVADFALANHRPEVPIGRK